MKNERVVDYMSSVIYYFSKEEGVRISARLLKKEGEDVDSITYESRQTTAISNAPQLTGANDREYLVHKFDEYSNIIFNDQKAGPDNFAIHFTERNGSLRLTSLSTLSHGQAHIRLKY